MRPWLSLLLLVVVGCDTPGTASDGSTDGMDGSTVGDGGVIDAGFKDPDAQVGCAEGQHECNGGCVDLLPNMPQNGCALGCSEPCPVADAICNPDGTCGTMGCTPMTCESLGAQCGIINNGCGGNRSCGGCNAEIGETCQDGQCVVVCQADPREGAGGNDTSATATNLGELNDDPDTSTLVGNATMHNGADQDWYRVTVHNTSDWGCCGDPKVTVTLGSIPTGSDYELAAWYECPPSDGSSPSCTTGAGDTSFASGGCTSTLYGTMDETVSFNTDCDDDGVLYVRVHAYEWAGTCDPYRLEIRVH